MIDTAEETHQVYRWVNGLQYTDSDGRNWTFNAIQCDETTKNGEKTRWAWVTSLEVNRQTVVEVATKGGRERWRAENEGYNTQKNSGLNLEHAYSHACWAAYYFLLQIAHLLLQLVEKGSLLRQLAKSRGTNGGGVVRLVEEHGGTVVGEPAVLALVRRGLRPNRSPLDPDSPGQQLAAGGGWACSRFRQVPQGLVAVTFEVPFEPVPLRPLLALGRHPRLFRMPATRPRSGFLRAVPERSIFTE